MFIRRERLWIVLVVAMILVLPAIAEAQLFTVSGTATDTNLGPVSGVNVVLFDNAGNPIGIPPTVTDSTGFYSISGLPSDNYIFGFEPLALTRLLPKLIEAQVQNNLTLDVILDPGHLLSGVVRDTTGVGIFNIDLNVTDKDTGVRINTPKDNTDSTGFYAVVVPTGEFDLKWRAVDPLVGPWISVELRQVFIDADTTIDVTMVLGVDVSGSVQDTTGAFVQMANLDFIDAQSGTKLDTPGDNTGATGSYRVRVPKATYDVRVKTNASAKLVGVEKLNVPIFSDTTLNFVMQPGFSVHGLVTNSMSSGVPAVDIDVSDAASGAKLFTPFDDTDSSGLYDVIVPPGVWDFVYKPLVSSRLAPVLLSGVSVAKDTTINVMVPDGVVLSGIVRDPNGFGVGGVDIDAKNSVTRVDVPLAGDNTAGNGTFAVVLPPAVYDLDFEPRKATRLVAVRLFDVSLTQDTTTAVALGPGFSVHGYVTDSVGTLIPNVLVEATTTPGGVKIFTPGNRTNAAGRYEIIIPADTYSLLYKPDSLSGIADSVVLENIVVFEDALINVAFATSIATGIPGGGPGGLLRIHLAQNHPNPFNPLTTIRFEIGSASQVRLVVHDVRGSLVKRIVSRFLPAGRHEASWDGTDDRGRTVASGIYFYRLQAGELSLSRKMLLLK